MRLTIATPIIAAGAAAPALTHGFHVASRPAATRTSTGLAARRSMFPMLRRSDLFFPDIDRLFDEMDEMMESSLAARFSRPSSSLLGSETLGGLKLRRPLGFEVVQDEKEYKMVVKVPGVEAKDINLQVDQDGRVLRLKGNRTYEEGDMKVRSRFEKAILLSPDVDTTKLAANMLGDVLTVVAPKIEKKGVVDKAKDKKIEVKVEEPKAALQDDGAPKIEKKNVLDKDEDKKIEIKVGEPEATLQDDGAPKIENKDVLDKAKDEKIEIKGSRRPLGFEVVQDEKEYKMAVDLPGVEAKDIDLQVDPDGRVLRLKGDRTYEEGGMKVQSRFQKAILLSPDVDTTKLAANMLGDVLTVVAPKIEKKDVFDKAEDKKIEIKVEGPEAAL